MCCRRPSATVCWDIIWKKCAIFREINFTKIFFKSHNNASRHYYSSSRFRILIVHISKNVNFRFWGRYQSCNGVPLQIILNALFIYFQTLCVIRTSSDRYISRASISSRESLPVSDYSHGNLNWKKKKSKRTSISK